MARGYNRIILMGNLARDPEIRYTASKQAVARLTVAVGRSWKDHEGNQQDHTDFIPVVVWGNQAENCEKYLRKGRPVLVEGRLQVRNYQTQSGEKRWVTEVVAQSVVFLGSGSRDSQDLDYGGFREPASSIGSLRDEFPEEFPTDISDVNDEGEEADIPF